MDPKTAIDFVIRQEDSTLSGVITNYSTDIGGLTRFGLCAKWHPELVAAGFYSEAMGRDQALSLAEQAYATSYVGLQLPQIASQGVGTALLSFAVLEGQEEAVKLLQEALGIDADGQAGPETLAAENAADPAALLPKLVELQRQHFAAIAAADPGQDANLRGWDNRADALLALA